MAAFFGVQSIKNRDRDAAYIDKKGIKIYIIMGFFLVFCLLIALFGIVQIILHFAL
ncbi:MAG: DUF2970 domain-containing protein [Proteobacteria bacterium]|nr:DUF2970 domain-containing protein [Pseudomonadota bacterium]